jgi:hypothetical protein
LLPGFVAIPVKHQIQAVSVEDAGVGCGERQRRGYVDSHEYIFGGACDRRLERIGHD